MSEPWEISIYPIVKDVILDNTDDEQLSEKEVNRIANIICQKIDKEYSIEKKKE